MGRLLALAAAVAFGVIVYGFVVDSALAMMGGFLAMLLALGLHELPVWRAIATEDAPQRPEGELLDFSEIDWSAWRPSDRDAA